MSSREQFEQAMKAKFDDLIDYRVCKNGDGEYMAWDMQVAWFAWQAATSAMEAKCAALAADNDTAMSALKQADEVVKSAYEKYVALADENMALKSARQNAMTLPETPATDAFLAEVRNEAGARAVELFAQTLGSPYAVRDEKCYEDGFTRAIEIVRGAQAPRFAAQLRKGGAA